MSKVFRAFNGILVKLFGIKIALVKAFGESTKLVDETAGKTIVSLRERTMTSENSLHNLVLAVRYIVKNKIEGDIVECGVWRGGSMMCIAETLMQLGVERDLYLYDTFTGMTNPTSVDRDFNGQNASKLMSNSIWRNKKRNFKAGVIAYANEDDVRQGMTSTNYPLARTHYIKGDVLDTLSQLKHKKIALLRLDTDWYESTKKELQQLWPLVTIGGILIIDDYDHWVGARNATDEYFKEQLIEPLLIKLHSGGRIMIKTKG